MAIVEKPTAPWALAVTLVDNGRNETTMRYQLQSADAAEAATDAAAVIAALNAVTDCVIKSYQIEHRYVENALVLPASGVEIQNQGIITVTLASDPTKSGTLVIPGIVPGAFVAASGDNANVIDTGDADINTYVDLFTATNEAYISDGELATLSFRGVRRHVKSRRG
jgi:hypothetical protein